MAHPWIEPVDAAEGFDGVTGTDPLPEQRRPSGIDHPAPERLDVRPSSRRQEIRAMAAMFGLLE